MYNLHSYVQECLAQLTPEETAPFTEAGIFDLCAEDDDIELLCSHAAELASYCESNLNMTQLEKQHILP
jgi:hypothetical protein